MKILKLPPYFYPEQVSSSHLTQDLYEAYRDAGIETEVFVPTPSRGIDEETRKKYRNVLEEKLYGGSVTVHRFPALKENHNVLFRAFRYISVHFKQYRRGIKAEGIDLIYGASTPPTQGILCAKVKKALSKRYGHTVPFIYCLQDVFPDSLVNAKITKKGSLIWKIGRKIEDSIYRNADLIIVIGEGIKENILKKGVPAEKIKVIPNWIDTEAVKPVMRESNQLFSELGLEYDKFYVTYAGNMGTAQGIDTILDAAGLLREEEDVRFIIFGGGSKRDLYAEKIKELNNVSLYPLQPPEKVSLVYSLGDLSIVACKKGVGASAVPSKTFSILATGTPIALSFDSGSELWNLIERNDCGYLAQADDAKGLAMRIMEAYHDRAVLKMKGENGLKLVKESYSKEHGTKAYIRVIQQAVIQNN